jgi:hypothetical protein
VTLGAVRDMVLRGLTIVVRAGFTFYLAKVLPLDAFGNYAYIAAASAFLVYLGGADFYAYAHREYLARRCSLNATIRAQGLFMAISLPVALIAGGLASVWTLEPWLTLWLLVIVLGETIGAELVRLLVVSSRPSSANVVLFLKSAAWMLPWAVNVHAGASITLSSVFLAWTAGLFLASAYGIWRLPVTLREAAGTPVPLHYFRSARSLLPRLLLGTLALRALFSLDRTLVEKIFGAEMTGIYGFYVAVASSYLAILDAGILARLSPALIGAVANGAHDPRPLLRSMQRWSLALGAVAITAYAVLIDWVIASIGKPALGQHATLGYVLLMAYTVFAYTTGAANILYGRSHDLLICCIHIAGLLPFAAGVLLAQLLHEPIWVAAGVLGGLLLQAFLKARAAAPRVPVA